MGLTISQSYNPVGWAIWNITGFVNPQFIGNSSTFAIIIKTNCISSGSGCNVSSIDSGLFAYASTAGDLPVLALYPDNSLINTKTSIYINLQLSAPIPVGGQLNILLPNGILPAIPISCKNISGYSLINGQSPACSYNSINNIVNTVNFAYPYIASTASAVLSL